MAVSLEQFVKQLGESGLLVGDELRDLLPPHANPTDAEALARELVRQNKLTKYQVEQISKGKGKSLVLGNYVILDKLGQGGMGMVLKARHTRMDRIVALKVMSSAAMKSPDAVLRFHREVKVAAKLEHPNIVTAYDADEAMGTHFLVMQYVEGTDLSALVKKKGPLSVAQTIRCITQAARGLEFAHQRGVIHRDIKPANLLLDNDGTVKILDMGLARIEGEVGAQAELTSTGAVMGTVDYMAPEQALSTKHSDARSDIYSLGITLWYLLTGRSAYVGDTLMSRLLAHRDSPIPSLCADRGDVPTSVDSVFARMVAKQPKDRYQSMTEVLRALGQLHDGAPSAATPLTVPLTLGDNQLSGFGAGLTSEHAMRATATRPQPPTATYAAPSEAATEATILSGDLAQVTISQSQAFGRSVIANASPATTPLTGPVSPWRYRRVQLGLLVALLFVIAIPFLLSRGKEHTDRSQLASAQSLEVSTAPDSQSKNGTTGESWHGWPLDAPKPVIAPFGTDQAQQPPPLAEWLKGRDLRTVAQDGSAEFKTIQAALDALQPGQVIKVLDRGPYRERLNRDPIPDDCGLISEAQTILELTEWVVRPGSPEPVGHHLHCPGAFRLHGFGLVFSTDMKSGRGLYVQYQGPAVIENCYALAPPANEFVAAVILNGWGRTEGQSAWVRDCLFRGQLIVTATNPEAIVVVEHNSLAGPGFASLAFGGTFGQLEIRNNVLGGGAKFSDIAFELDGIPRLGVRNNTSLSRYPLQFARVLPKGKVNFVNNLRIHPGFVVLAPGIEQDLPAAAGNWQFAGNAFPRQLNGGEFDLPKQNIYPASTSDVVGLVKLLSPLVTDADYLRIPADSPLATKGAGGDLPSYIGALPPGPAPEGGDWFTQLRERWSKTLTP